MSQVTYIVCLAGLLDFPVKAALTVLGWHTRYILLKVLYVLFVEIDKVGFAIFIAAVLISVLLFSYVVLCIDSLVSF